MSGGFLNETTVANPPGNPLALTKSSYTAAEVMQNYIRNTARTWYNDGVELNDEARKYAFQRVNRTTLEMAKPGKGHLFVYNILDWEPSVLCRYDAVFLLDVIEHIDHDVSFLRAGLRHLRSGRSVAVNVAASMLFFSDDDSAAGHVRRYTSAGLRKLLHSCGVEVEAVEPWGMLMTPLLLARKLSCAERPAGHFRECVVSSYPTKPALTLYFADKANFARNERRV
jgi:hypothetical protein